MTSAPEVKPTVKSSDEEIPKQSGSSCCGPDCCSPAKSGQKGGKQG